MTTIDVPVTRDNIAEEMETFDLNLSIRPELGRRVTPGNITTATATIIDDTGETELVYYSVNELDFIIRSFCAVWSGNVQY